MKLVLAEKPSVAMSLSKVIGANQRGDGYMEGNGYLVSWCVGHLVELSQPESYDEKYARWKYDDLPILPEHWQYQVSASTKKQFGILKKLMQRKDVESLICATDAGREGELIFRLVYHQCGCKKPVERLWISSMEDSAIQEGFQKLRPGTEYDALYEAALCRERADWIVGINATRLFSCLYGQTLNVGRVMTPTLAMVVMRDAAIRAFKSEPFYSAELKFRDFQAGGERMKEKAEAEKLVAECCQAGSAIITKVEQKEKSENPEELARIREKQKELGIRNTGAYMRKMAMDGYCVNLDLSDVAQVSTLLRRCSNNLNQYAKRANESGSIYAEDIRDLQKRLDELWEMQKLILKRLSGIR